MNPVEPSYSDVARPYHERWSQILGYPLQPAALSTLAAIAVSHLVAHIPLGFILDLLVWSALFKYAFEVLRASANGHEQAPEFSFTVSDAIGRYAVLLFVLAEVALLLLALWYGLVVALALGLVLMFAMPAIVMVLALDEGMLRALNPIAWLALIARLGRKYFVLVGFFCAALIVQSVIGAVIANAVPAVIATPLVFFVVNYLLIANFHLIGWVIHEHADELGYSGHLAFHATAADASAEERTLDAARGRAAGGDVPGAIALLRAEIAAQPSAFALHEEYRHWLASVDDSAELLAHAKSYIPLLLEKDKDRRAIEIARESRVLDAQFALDRAEDVTRLAHDAAEAGQTQLALGLLAGFHQRFRNHADIARNYLLAAKLFAERTNQEMMARALLQQIKLALPNDALIPQVDAYIAFLDQLAATPAKPARSGA